MALGTIVSILLPYRPVGLKQRWRLRRTWFRWGIALGIPYALYLIVGWSSVPVRISAHGRRDVHPQLYALLSLAWGLGYWIVGTVVATQLAHRHQDRLLRRLRETAADH